MVSESRFEAEDSDSYIYCIFKNSLKDTQITLLLCSITFLDISKFMYLSGTFDRRNFEYIVTSTQLHHLSQFTVVLFSTYIYDRHWQVLCNFH